MIRKIKWWYNKGILCTTGVCWRSDEIREKLFDIGRRTDGSTEIKKKKRLVMRSVREALAIQDQIGEKYW